MEKAEIYRTLNEAYFSATPHEQQVLDELPALLRDASFVVDVGASLGQYTNAAARAMSGAEIWAIEADPLRAEELTRNALRWSNETATRIVVHQLALCDTDTEATTYYVTNSDVSGALEPHSASKPVTWEEITVRGARLDTVLGGRIPDLIKIDVEGAELAVLRGAANTLASRRALFLIELHDWTNDAKRVRSLMRDVGYHYLSFYGQPLFVPNRPAWVKLAATTMGRRGIRRLQRYF